MTQNPDPAEAVQHAEDDLDDIRELADVPAIEVISRAAVMLMSSAAEKLGLSDENPETSPNLDLDEARRVITALAGLVTASVEYLGPHAGRSARDSRPCSAPSVRHRPTPTSPARVPARSTPAGVLISGKAGKPDALIPLAPHSSHW